MESRRIEKAREHVERGRDAAKRLYDALEGLPGFGAIFESLQAEQRSGAPLLAGGLAYRLFFWLCAFGLLIAAIASFWVSASPQDAESAAKSFGLAGVAAQSATEAIESGSHARWYFLGTGIVLLAYFGMGAIRALRLTAVLAWRLESVKLRRPLHASAAFTGFLIMGIAAGVGAQWLAHHAPGGGWLAIPAAAVLFTGVALIGFRLLPHGEVDAWRAFLPGAVEVGVGLAVIQLFVVYYLAAKLQRSPDLYGALGAATVVLLWLFLLGRLLVAGLFLNATVVRRAQAQPGGIWTPRRSAALVALTAGGVALWWAVAVAVSRFPSGVAVVACLTATVAVAWWAFLRRGVVRVAGFALAAVLFLAMAALVVGEGRVLQSLILVGAAAVSLSAAGRAFTMRAELPAAPRPERPVLFFNPGSGGGKAERFHVAEEARRRGIEVRELRPGDDLRELVRTAINDGADALAMAGGDGSQAIVAAEAAAHGLPYACIPSGTRNHFALDLGVDRDDVVGALDALVDGRERVVDLAEVNGRVFVNNVSLGVYADSVERAGYRDAKIKTVLETAPHALAPKGTGPSFEWIDPQGREQGSAAALLVSNDRYRLGHALGTGTRPRLDAGQLGIAAIGLMRNGAAKVPRFEEWSAPTFEIRADGPLPAGIDGESVRLDPPLRFSSRPRALRVRIAPHHPAASPSAGMPASAWDALLKLLEFAVARGA